MKQRRTPWVEKFWMKVQKGEGDACWIWLGKRHPRSGHGIATIGHNRRTYAHRVSFALTTGNWPTLNVLHSCDNPPCCNPAHLREGTQADNVRDMVERGRSLKGDRQPNARLTTESATAILHSPLNARQLAAIYGVSQTCVYDIRARRRWGHLA